MVFLSILVSLWVLPSGSWGFVLPTPLWGGGAIFSSLVYSSTREWCVVLIGSTCVYLFLFFFRIGFWIGVYYLEHSLEPLGYYWTTIGQGARLLGPCLPRSSDDYLMMRVPEVFTSSLTILTTRKYSLTSGFVLRTVVHVVQPVQAFFALPLLAAWHVPVDFSVGSSSIMLEFANRDLELFGAE